MRERQAELDLYPIPLAANSNCSEIVGADLVGDGLGVRPPLEGDSRDGGTGPKGCAGEAEGVHGGLSRGQLMGVGLDVRFPGSVDVFRQWSEFGPAWRELQSCVISRERLV